LSEFKEFLQNALIEKRTLDSLRVNSLRSDKRRTKRWWVGSKKLQTLGSQFREAALLNRNEGAREGTLDLSDRLRNICSIQKLASDLFQTIVRSRNYQNFDEIAETALVEESTTASKQERYRAEGVFAYRCSNCGKPGHSSNK